jgi:DNA-binding Xre family transcriptional regulator
MERFEMLGKVIAAFQQKYDVESKVLAREIGISESSLCRIKRGALPDAASLAKIMVWLTK